MAGPAARPGLGEPRVISVWAPVAGAVEIEWSGDGAPVAREAMSRDDDGWWHWDGDPAAYQTFDYAFVLDGAEPSLPDPRSAWQPHGVHSPSRFFDASRFVWSDQQWRGTRCGAGVLGGLVYELHVGTFTPEGTLDAAIERLDALVAIGVDLVELMPLAAFPGDWGWGYDGVALYAVHDRYGGPAALQRFVDAAHARGIGVCLDLVHNHLGPSGNYLSRFGPYFTDTHHTPWGSAVNLDAPGSDGVRSFLVDQVLRWFRDFHVDALRLDAVHELADDSPHHLLAELSDATATLATELGRPLDLIAESDLNDVTMVEPTALGGRGMTAQWADDVHHALHVVLSGESQGYYADFAGGGEREEAGPLAVLAKVFTRGFLHDGSFSSFRGALWGRAVDVDTFDARRLLAYLQTHDQVGNRALGDRLHATLSPGRHAIGAALVLLGPFTPMLFMGEEWAAATPWQFFTSFDDLALGEAVSRGRREEFGSHGWSVDEVPDPQAVSTRDASVLDWSEPGREPHAHMLGWYAACSALRHRLLPIGSPLRLADVLVSFDEAARWVVVSHHGLAIAANLADHPQTVPVPDGAVPLLRWADHGSELRGISEEGLVLDPDDCAVLRLTP